MSDVKLLNQRDRALVALAAVVSSLSLVCATLLAFAVDGRTEWFAGGSDAALAALRCDKAAASSARHACLREVAEARRAAETASSRIAKR
jgi:hypothetical protein